MSRDEVLRDYEEYKAKGRVWGQVPVERISKIKFPRPEKSVIDRYLALPDMTTTVSDLLDTYGIVGAVAASHIKPLMSGRQMVGTAVTLRSIPERKTVTQGYLDKEPIKMSTREIYYLSEPGDVLVADFGGNLDVSNMGGQSALVGKHQASSARSSMVPSVTCPPSANWTSPSGRPVSHPSQASSAWKPWKSTGRCVCTTWWSTLVT